MFQNRFGRFAPFVVGLAALFAFSAIGCGGGADGTTVKVSPEVQKKTEDYLQNYQKSMYDQHKPKAKSTPKKTN